MKRLQKYRAGGGEPGTAGLNLICNDNYFFSSVSQSDSPLFFCLDQVSWHFY